MTQVYVKKSLLIKATQNVGTQVIVANQSSIVPVCTIMSAKEYFASCSFFLNYVMRKFLRCIEKV